jgi:hypothetical protein
MTNHFTRVPPVFLDVFEIEQVPAHFRDACNRLLARIDFLEAPSMREQVHIACEELHGPDDIRVPLKAIAGLLGLSRDTLFNHLHRLIETKAIGRPKCLRPEAHEMIWRIIANPFERLAPVTSNFCLILFSVSLGQACGQISFTIFVAVFPE